MDNQVTPNQIKAAMIAQRFVWFCVGGTVVYLTASFGYSLFFIVLISVVFGLAFANLSYNA